MVYVEIIFQWNVDWTMIPNTKVVKTFPRIKHIPYVFFLDIRGYKKKSMGKQSTSVGINSSNKLYKWHLVQEEGVKGFKVTPTQGLARACLVKIRSCIYK
jgi:hypothetical protein